jgi:hypothetical protein
VFGDVVAVFQADCHPKFFLPFQIERFAAILLVLRLMCVAKRHNNEAGADEESMVEADAV